MNPEDSVFENLAFNPVNLETVLLSEVQDKNLFKESLADLGTKYFFPETFSDHFHILYLNVRSLQKHFDGFKSMVYRLFQTQVTIQTLFFLFENDAFSYLNQTHFLRLKMAHFLYLKTAKLLYLEAMHHLFLKMAHSRI